MSLIRLRKSSARDKPSSSTANAFTDISYCVSGVLGRGAPFEVIILASWRR